MFKIGTPKSFEKDHIIRIKQLSYANERYQSIGVKSPNSSFNFKIINKGRYIMHNM